MPDTGAPWNIPYVAASDLVKDWPTDSQELAEAVAAGLDAAGGLVAVSYATKTDTFSTSSTSFVDVTGLEVSHTCAGTANAVIVIANMGQFGGNATTSNNFARLTAGTAVILEPASEGQGGFYSDNQSYGMQTLVARHNPASTSAITYGVEVKTSGGTVYVNRRHTAGQNTASTILVLEVQV